MDRSDSVGVVIDVAVSLGHVEHSPLLWDLP